MRLRSVFVVLCLSSAPAMALLPPLTPEQQAAAEEKKAKAAEAAKKDAELLGKYQDRAVDNYKRSQQSKSPPSGPQPPRDQ